MQPLRLTIPGEYWDSYIYKGRLYLFCVDGTILTLNWDRLIGSWSIAEDLRIALVCAFLRSDYLYLKSVQDLLRDPEIRRVMSNKFAKIANMRLEVEQPARSSCLLGEQENPFPFPHSDLEIYGSQLYSGSVDGVFVGSCGGRTIRPVSTKPTKKWDGPALGISAGYGALGIASGSEGLFQLDLDSYGGRADPQRLSDTTCFACNWVYYSLFASGVGSGYLAEFTRERGMDSVDEYKVRRFQGLSSAQQIFGSTGQAWGARDRLCQAQQRSIKVVKYEPWAKEQDLYLQDLGDIHFEAWKGDIVAGRNASFGTIVELDQALVVIPSEGESVTLPGEPVNWRVFPRSIHYQNQLHVVHDDKLEILSFNQDYLVDQDRKLSGSSPYFGSGWSVYGSPSLLK